MSTYKELIHMVLDELKLNSDDAQFTEEHIAFLLNKYRAFSLKQKYSDLRKVVPEGNYQTICLTLVDTPAIDDEPCEGSFIKSTVKIPNLIHIGAPRVYPVNYYKGDIALIDRERMRYVGYNKYLQNIIYASIGPDKYLYMTSSNPQVHYLEQIKITGVFEDANAASDLQCSDDTACDMWDRIFPIEDALVPMIINLVVKEIGNVLYTPDDASNNDSDDLSNVKVKNSNAGQQQSE